MKKALLLILLSLSLIACGSDEDARSNSPANSPTGDSSANAGSEVSTNPVAAVYVSPTYLKNASNEELEMAVRKFMTIENLDGKNDADIQRILDSQYLGSMINAKGAGQAIHIELFMAEGSLSRPDLVKENGITLQLTIYDSYVKDFGFAPMVYTFGKNKEGGLQQSVDFQYSGNNISIKF